MNRMYIETQTTLEGFSIAGKPQTDNNTHENHEIEKNENNSEEREKKLKTNKKGSLLSFFKL